VLSIEDRKKDINDIELQIHWHTVVVNSGKAQVPLLILTGIFVFLGAIPYTKAMWALSISHRNRRRIHVDTESVYADMGLEMSKPGF
jgi:hypothetical protein